MSVHPHKLFLRRSILPAGNLANLCCLSLYDPLGGKGTTDI